MAHQDGSLLPLSSILAHDMTRWGTQRYKWIKEKNISLPG
jgi:hypothetical protein